MAGPSAARRWFRRALGLVVAAFVLVAALAALGVFTEETSYRVIHHPTHEHYVPKECGDNVQAGNFPMRAPAENERITCDGTIISR